MGLLEIVGQVVAVLEGHIPLKFMLDIDLDFGLDES